MSQKEKKYQDAFIKERKLFRYSLYSMWAVFGLSILGIVISVASVYMIGKGY
jgi:hypothetical protein